MGAPTRFDGVLPATTTTPNETLSLGKQLAERLEVGDIVALYGNLGAGKTHLTKGICSALGIDPYHVNSPTFKLVNEYPGRTFPIYHFDAYRIERIEEFFEFGYEDYFYGDGLCLIEWPERIEALLPPETLRLHLTVINENERYIEALTAQGLP